MASAHKPFSNDIGGINSTSSPSSSSSTSSSSSSLSASGTSIGRPPFNSATLNEIRVNERQDRRHLLHWAEHLKPMLFTTFERLWATTNGNRERYRKQLLRIHNEYANRRLSDRTDVKTLERKIAKDLNSAISNLVPGNANVNKAIEHMRHQVREAIKAINESPGLSPAEAVQLAFTKISVEITLREVDDPTEIRHENSHRTEDPENPRELPSDRLPLSRNELISLLHDIIDSLTFDLSEAAQRDKIEATLGWWNVMNYLKRTHDDGVAMLCKIREFSLSPPKLGAKLIEFFASDEYISLKQLNKTQLFQSSSSLSSSSSSSTSMSLPNHGSSSALGSSSSSSPSGSTSSLGAKPMDLSKK